MKTKGHYPLPIMNTYVYVYKTEEKEPFYVGIGTGYRAWAHLRPSTYMPYDAEYPSFYGKIKKMKLAGIEPIIEKVFEGTREECIKLEAELIRKYGLVVDGGKLYNISNTTGGRVKGKKYPMNDATLKRYRESRKEIRVYDIMKDDLYRMYIAEGKTRKEISEHYGCSEPLVKNRLKEYGIRRG